MKKRMNFLITSFLLLGISLKSQISTVNRVAYYSFSGNANDESGNNNNGTVSGATLTTDKNGIANSAYSFVTPSDILTGTLNPCWTNSRNFTVSAWIKTSGNIRQDILGLGTRTTNNGIFFHVNDGGYLGCDLTNNPGVVSDTKVNDDKWHFVTATLTDNLMQVYIDGISSGKPQVMQPDITCEFMRIGRYINPSGTILYQFNGSIDEISVYSRALTLCEINKLGGISSCVVDAINDVQLSDEATIYPNPASGKITVQSSDSKEISIYNNEGSLVLLQNISESKEVNVQHLNAGLYFYKVGTKQGKLILK